MVLDRGDGVNLISNDNAVKKLKFYRVPKKFRSDPSMPGRGHLKDFLHAVLWRLTSTWLGWSWVPMTVFSLYLASTRPRSAMWEGAIDDGVTVSYPLVIAASTVAAIMSGVDRRSFVSSNRFGRRPLLNTLSIVACCVIQASVGMMLVIFMSMAKFSAVANLRLIDIMPFLVGLSWSLFHVILGVFIGSSLPLWLSLPIAPAFSWILAILPAVGTDTWLGLFTFVDDGVFIPLTSEPRDSVLIGQCAIAIGLSAMLLLLGLYRHLILKHRLMLIFLIMFSVLASSTIFIITGPVRTHHELVHRNRYCLDRVCGIADNAGHVRLTDKVLSSSPNLLKEFGIPDGVKLTDAAASPDPGDVVLTNYYPDAQNSVEGLLRSLIVYRWCGAQQQGSVKPDGADFIAFVNSVAHLPPDSVQLNVKAPPPPSGLVCSAR